MEWIATYPQSMGPEFIGSQWFAWDLEESGKESTGKGLFMYDETKHPRPRGISRTTISLPKELHKQMKKRRDINWSAVAANAFERKLSEQGKGAGLQRK